MKTVIFTAILILCSSVALATADKLLTGSYRVGGQTLVDPPESELQTTHFYIELTGASAQDLYNALNVNPVYDQCANDGSKTKTKGKMECSRSADGEIYRCWFGIDLKSQQITNGVVC